MRGRQQAGPQAVRVGHDPSPGQKRPPPVVQALQHWPEPEQVPTKMFRLEQRLLLSTCAGCLVQVVQRCANVQAAKCIATYTEVEPTSQWCCLA